MECGSNINGSKHCQRFTRIDYILYRYRNNLGLLRNGGIYCNCRRLHIHYGKFTGYLCRADSQSYCFRGNILHLERGRYRHRYRNCRCDTGCNNLLYRYRNCRRLLRNRCFNRYCKSQSCSFGYFRNYLQWCNSHHDCKRCSFLYVERRSNINGCKYGYCFTFSHHNVYCNRNYCRMYGYCCVYSNCKSQSNNYC